MDLRPSNFKILGTIVAAHLVFGTVNAECVIAGKIEALQGDVYVRHQTDKSWQTASLSHALCQYDQLKTSPLSRASIRLNNDTLVQMDQKTTLTLSNIGREQEKSFLDLIEGLIHTLSRVPRSLDVRTPYVNAHIEGTEFVVTHSADGSKVAIVEGKVRVANAQGSVLLTANEAVTAQANQAPQKQLLVNPLQGVAWEINYLPVTHLNHSQLSNVEREAWRNYQANEPDKALEVLTPLIENNQATDNALIIAAAAQLQLGQAEAARKIITSLQKDNASALALRITIAIAENQLPQAEQLLESAATSNRKSADLDLAKTYLQQAKHQLSKALRTAKSAHQKYPDNALLTARLSELHLMSGNAEKAEQLAERALKQTPKNSALITALGFALLNNGKTQKAQTTFAKAVEYNSTHSLNHLGLGLSKIKQGDLAKGREHLETAVLLAPRYSLLRSYLAKAYFEEIRNRLVYDQLELAKQNDPADPTPWLYEAIALHDDNRAIEALQSMEKSIELNDNRVVYRSEFLLDDDQASRSTALGGIYQALGFEQKIIGPATRALTRSPENSSPHRLLADAYRDKYHLSLARKNELLQAQLYAPIGQKLIPAQTLLGSTRLLEESGPLTGGYNEHNALFLPTGSFADLSAKAGTQGTREGEITAGLIEDSAALQASLYHMETEGENPDLNAYDTHVASIDLSWQMTPSLQLQLNHNESETDKGQLSQRFLQEELTLQAFEHETDDQTSSASLIFKTSVRSQWAFKISRNKLETQEATTPIPNVSSFLTKNTTINRYFLQNIFHDSDHTLITGVEYTDFQLRSDFNSTTGLTSDTRSEGSQNRFYAYWNAFLPTFKTDITAGLERLELNDDGTALDRIENLPKLGLSWSLGNNTQVSTAWFKSLSDVYAQRQSETLMPSQIAGFNQFNNLTNRNLNTTTGLAVEHRINNALATGIRLSRNKGESKQNIKMGPGTPGGIYDVETEQDNGTAWLYWTLSNRLSLSLEHQYESLKDGWEQTIGSSTDSLEDLITRRTPITLSYHHPSGFSGHLINTYIKQKGVFWKPPTSQFGPEEVISDSDSFWLTDASVSYRLPKRRGTFVVGVKNLFDQNYNYEDFSSFALLEPANTWVPSDYVRERFWFASVSLHFN